MFVSQIHCIVSPLCLLLTGWANDKFSLSQDALTDSAVCHNAKRLTINCCHCTLSDVPISLPYTHNNTLDRWEGFLSPSSGTENTRSHSQQRTYSAAQYFSSWSGRRSRVHLIYRWARAMFGEMMAPSAARDKWNHYVLLCEKHKVQFLLLWSLPAEEQRPRYETRCIRFQITDNYFVSCVMWHVRNVHRVS